MTNEKQSADNSLSEQPFVSHLIELRDRLMRAVIAVVAIFIVLFPFANDLYQIVSKPLLEKLPQGHEMIATGVISPFLAPFKLSLVAAIFIAMPFILYQFWSFVAPGLYKHEKRVLMPMVASSALLFYMGALFAFYVVFPLVFSFMVATTPEGVNMAPDITQYLEFVLTLFFAFGLAFEVPIATIILVWMGVTSPDKMAQKRPYVIVGAFCIGMFLTPPDVISQTLLALPMWVLFEIGVFFSRFIYKQKQIREQQAEAEVEQQSPGDDPDQSSSSSGNKTPASPSGTGGAAVAAASDTIPGFDGDPDPVEGIDTDRFVPLTEAELDEELDAIEAQEALEDDDEDDYDEDDYEEDDLGHS
ncbi:MAG: twin-arginine translocase subunit TatC, partial [Chromatiales bacterium]|nr:twin-arginine translocase subunit TatC [Chromatiales bacterium]